MNLSKSILATLAYHDIFNYPLKEQEILNFLIENKSNSRKISKELKKLISQKKIGERDGYFYLAGKQSSVTLRKKRKKFSEAKFKRAIKYAALLKIIPTVKFIAVSGALAMQNCQEKDDIDFIIVTSQKSLWTTRLLSNLILSPFKRSPNSLKTKNKACLNIFIEESQLSINPQNVYIAHEICQMKPIWSKDKTYSKLVKKNRWVLKYLPQWKKEKIKESRGINQNLLLPKMIFPIENILKKTQLKYMEGRITTEKIGDKQLFFHPQDTQNYVIDNYYKKLKKLLVP